jgi:N-acetylmuramoyl-L-alanine amidase
MPDATPIAPYDPAVVKQWLDAANKFLLALVIWREARGESYQGKVAVASVIRNRVEATHLPDQWDNIIERKWQFSSMTAPGDAMLVQWPLNEDLSWIDSLAASEGVYSGALLDNTGGATLYANLHVCQPKWDFSKLTQTVVIGNHTFFKEQA